MTDHEIARTLLFKNPGPKNTTLLLEAAAERFKSLNLKKVIIATCTGRTVREALVFFPPQQVQVIAVSHVCGFGAPNEQKLPDEERADLAAQGVKIVTAGHAFGGVGRGIRNTLNTFQSDEIMAFTLRMLGQGVKVGVEIALMAADAGLVRTDEDVLVIGGTGRGADTAMVVQPANSHRCLELKVREIIAKPWSP